MKKRIKIVAVVMAVMLSGVVGALMQKYFFTEKEVQEIIKSNEFTTDEVVVVNLDEGIQSGNTTINYGNELLAKIDVNTVGLDEARTGVTNGVYAGYVIIPESFSNSVESINLANPETAILKYEFSENLNKEAQKTSTEKIQSIEDTLNYEIGYMYLTSILKEVHDGQDQATAVMQNDQTALDAVNSIQSVDLITMVEITEFDVIEKDTPTLDTGEEEANYQAVVDEMKVVNEENKTSIMETYAAVTDAIEKLKEEKFTWDIFTNEDGELVYNGQAIKDKVANDVTKNTNDAIDKSVDTAVDKSVDDSVDKAVDETLTEITNQMNYDISVIQGTELQDLLTLQTNVQTRCIKTIIVTPADPDDPTSVDVMGPNPDYNATTCELLIENFSNGTYETTLNPSTYIPTTISVGGVDKDIKLHIKDSIKPTLKSQLKDPLKTQVKTDSDILTKIETTINSIITVDNTTNEINGGYIKRDLLDSLQKHYSGYTTEMNELNREVDKVESTASTFRIEGILNSTNSKLDSKLTNINSNTALLLKEVDTLAGEYETRQKEIETEANLKITEISTNVSKSQQESNEKIEAGLQSAKESVVTSTGNNSDLLYRFTSKLKNTKYGETQSKEVKDHILNPAVKDGDGVSAPSIAASTPTTDEDDSLPTSWLYIGGIGVVLLLLTVGYVVFSKKETEE
ncbi:YhgE/Pip domain-containing protein [Breznakia pachnodae]|uniref:Phage infection (PIP) family protein YhgE n=1 Tax=Breznakia pachnodae TaxID=265178 RepID=A0ABU0E1V3_9FIRM|nr:hypothetical protein [Breznakia pachnodae]MDQ0360869.1 putative phage infection (PIP) family protein YhgE [Breznakia pachnodae]